MRPCSSRIMLVLPCCDVRVSVRDGRGRHQGGHCRRNSADDQYRRTVSRLDANDAVVNDAMNCHWQLPTSRLFGLSARRRVVPQTSLSGLSTAPTAVRPKRGSSTSCTRSSPRRCPSSRRRAGYPSSLPFPTCPLTATRQTTRRRKSLLVRTGFVNYIAIHIIAIYIPVLSS